MKNISGSAAKWINDENKSYNRKEEVEEIIPSEYKPLNVEEIKDLVKRLIDDSNKIDELYRDTPKKDLFDSSIMIKCIIRSLSNLN